jgi:SurA N-terminal domain
MENETSTVVSKKSGNGKKIVVAIVVLIILAVGGYFIFKHGGAGIMPSPSVATVNGVAISKSAFDTQLTSTLASYGVSAASTTPDQLAQIKQQVLSNMIDNELLKQGAKAAGVTASSTEVDAQYQTLLTQNGGADGLKAALVKAGLTDAQLRQNIADQLVIQAYLLKNIDVSAITASDAEIAAFYAQYSAQQKAAGTATVPALATLSAQIKQQIISNKENTLVSNFIATLQTSATIATSSATSL